MTVPECEHGWIDSKGERCRGWHVHHEQRISRRVARYAADVETTVCRCAWDACRAHQRPYAASTVRGWRNLRRGLNQLCAVALGDRYCAVGLLTRTALSVTHRTDSGPHGLGALSQHGGLSDDGGCAGRRHAGEQLWPARGSRWTRSFRAVSADDSSPFASRIRAAGAPHAPGQTVIDGHSSLQHLLPKTTAKAMQRRMTA